MKKQAVKKAPRAKSKAPAAKKVAKKSFGKSEARVYKPQGTADLTGKNLVIVESPAKGRTIKGFLGKDWEVKASFGHVSDLPQKTLGIDVKK